MLYPTYDSAIDYEYTSKSKIDSNTHVVAKYHHFATPKSRDFRHFLAKSCKK